MLVDAARGLLRKSPLAMGVERPEAREESWRPLWREMAQLGWMGVMIPEGYGGSGGSFLDLVLLLEEMGYHACPGPFFSTVILGALPIMICGSDAQKEEFLPRVARGELVITLALTEPSASYEPSRITTTAHRLGDGSYHLNGTKLFVPDADLAQHLVFVARTQEVVDPEEGITLFMVDMDNEGIECTRLKTLAKDSQCEVVFRDVRVPREAMLGAEGMGWPCVKHTLDAATVGRCAEMVGGARYVMDMAVAYAKERVQFGRPIGGFQAIHQHLADMWVEICGSRNLLYKTAWLLSEGLPASKEVSMLKAKVGEAYRRVTTLGHQILGAIGFTMEHPMHLYHRRAMAGDLAFGNADFHKELVAGELGL